MVRYVNRFILRVGDGILLAVGKAMLFTALATSLIAHEFVTRRKNGTKGYGTEQERADRAVPKRR